MNQSQLRGLAECAGIEPDYIDTWGNRHDVPIATQRALLNAMGLAADSDEAIRQSLEQLREREQRAPKLQLESAPAWRPGSLRNEGRRWGLQVQLYALRSERNWGMGDLTDLAELIRGAAELGAAAVGLNPLHALFPSRPDYASPYSPSSRLFLNPLYLDVEAVPDFRNCERARRHVFSNSFQARLRGLRDAPLVDYVGVAEAKYDVLETLYDTFRHTCLTKYGDPRGRDFREFQTARGDALHRFATFNALAEQTAVDDWRDWQPQWRAPDDEAVTDFATRHVERIEFHEYLQWQTDAQLQAASDLARGCDMGIGLYTDLAVGADPGGADAWSDPRATVKSAGVGAPPDQLNLKGQNWGLPPADPLIMREQGYAAFIAVLEANMRHAGAVRVDHILGLMRLYWIPVDASARDGAYVRYPWRDLLTVLAEQSRRHRCLVVGEDLGTVPAGLREAMADAGILSCRLLYFEKDEQGFRPPANYPVEALTAIGTHDLPTLPAWWHGDDIALRERLDLWPGDAQRVEALEERERDRLELMNALHGVDPRVGGSLPREAPVSAIYDYLAHTPSRLVMVRLEDVLEQRAQVNVPGTTDEYPNWRQRLTRSVGDLLRDPRLLDIAHALDRERGGFDDSPPPAPRSSLREQRGGQE